MLCPMGMEYQQIHVCPNDCILYINEFEEMHKCPRCGVSRYKVKDDDECSSDESTKMLLHLGDFSQWKKINCLYLDFGKEAINLRLGLATDGMNPYGSLSTQYSL